jgi:hypothetical protein
MFQRPNATRTLVFTLLLALCGGLQAGTIIGPGDTATDANDGAAPLVAVDLAHSHFLPAGTYMASSFNYQFTTSVGSATPALEISNGSGGYTTIAVGNSVTDTGTTPFQSTAFGGSNLFSVPVGGENVYAAVYVSGSSAPVGFLDGSGSTYINYSGANIPAVGVDVGGGGGTGTFSRTYDFSIAVTSVPEPCSLVLCGLGAASLFVAARRRKV